MVFQLLMIVFVLIIFGITHSQAARERLLFTETYYNWPLEAISQGLLLISAPEDNHQLSTESGDSIIDIHNSTELDQEQDREREPIKASSVEEIQGIRFRISDNAEGIISEDEGNGKAKLSPSQNEKQNENGENIDQMLAAITGSLQKLSAGKAGSQLYDILMQESKIKNNVDGQSSSEPTNEKILQNGEELQEGENNLQGKENEKEKDSSTKQDVPTKLYFGETPLEYVPNEQK